MKYVLHHIINGKDDIIETYSVLYKATDDMIEYVEEMFDRGLISNKDTIYLKGPDPWLSRQEVTYIIYDKGYTEKNLYKKIEKEGNYYITVFFNGDTVANEETEKLYK